MATHSQSSLLHELRRVLEETRRISGKPFLERLVVTLSERPGTYAQVAHLRDNRRLLDIGLPKLNGYEVAKKIRKTDWGRNLVLVAITGWGQEDDRRRCQEAGFDHHLVKPVDLGTLERLLLEVSTGGETPPPGA